MMGLIVERLHDRTIEKKARSSKGDWAFLL